MAGIVHSQHIECPQIMLARYDTFCDDRKEKITEALYLSNFTNILSNAMCELSGEHIQALRFGLQSAFPERIDLEIFLREELGKTLSHYSGATDPLKATVFRLISSAEAEGWVVDLTAKAYQRRPHVRKLTAVAKELGVASPEDEDVQAAEDQTEESEPPENLWRSINPYRGLLALREQDAIFFFGRDQDTLTFVDAIANHSNKLLLALGASGVGKSSLIFAGLFAALNRQVLPGRQDWPAALHDSDRWPRLILTPGTEPVRSLVRAFIRQWFDPKTAAFAAEEDNWRDHLLAEKSIERLVAAADAARSEKQEEPASHYLIYVDQGEELYTRAGREPGRDGSRQETLQQREARRFSELLAEAATHPRLIVLMSARSDFLDRLQADKPIYRVRHLIDVEPLEEANLLEVVQRPAEVLGVTFETGLAEVLVASAREQAGGLPLLSDTLETLWKEMQDRPDNAPVLRWNGGTGDTIDVAHKLIERADAFVKSHRDQERVIRRLFCIHFAHVPQQGQPTRKRAFTEKLLDTERSLIAELASPEQRIIAAGSVDGRAYAEVAHEALFAAWSTLRGWIDERRGFYAWSTQIAAERKDWENEGQRSAHLLTGRPLERAKSFLETNEDDVPQRDAEFIRESIAADCRRNADDLRRGTLIFRGIVGALVVTALLALAAGWFGYQARQVANREQLARSRYLAGFATESLTRGDVDNAIGLSRAALPADIGVPENQIVIEAFNTLYSAYAQKRYGLRILQGHNGAVSGALELRDGRLLTWSRDNAARLWAADGTPGAVLKGHEKAVTGALELRDGRLLTWSGDNAARLWAADGTPGAVLKGHEGDVSGALELKDGRLLTWSGDKTARLWAADGTPGPVLKGHEDEVTGALELKDGRLLTWSGDKTARLWAADGMPGPVVKGHKYAVTGALELKDGRLLSWSRDKTTRLWAADGTPGPVLKGHEDAVTGALELKDGRLLTWSGDAMVRLWAADGTPGPVLMGHENRVWGALELKDGRLLTWSGDNTARLWAADGTPGPVLKGHEDWVWGALELQDGRLLTWSGDKTARLWAADGTPGPVLKGHEGEVAGALELKDGRLLTWSGDKTVRLWAANGTPGPVLMGHEDGVTGALELKDGRLLTWSGGIQGRRDKTARLWAADGTPGPVLMGHEDAVRGALELKDGRLLTWSWNIPRSDATARLWAADGTPGPVLMGHEDGVTGALELKDGRLLTWSRDATARLWAADGTSGPVLMGHEAGAAGALELKDGRLLAWSGDNTARLWAADGTPGPVLKGHEDWVLGALELQDGRLLTWSGDKTARLWAADGTPGPVLKGHEGEVAGALELKDGRLLTWSGDILRGGDKTARLWTADGTPGPVLKGHEGEVAGALELKDDRLLTWSWDKTARLWAADGAPGPVLKGHEDAVTGALELKDGRLLTWSRDKTARLWAADGTPGPVLKGHEAGVTGALELKDGRVLTWSEDKTARLWPLPEGLVSWGDRYIEDLVPLSHAERCRYYLEPDDKCSHASQ